MHSDGSVRRLIRQMEKDLNKGEKKDKISLEQKSKSLQIDDRKVPLTTWHSTESAVELEEKVFDGKPVLVDTGNDRFCEDEWRRWNSRGTESTTTLSSDQSSHLVGSASDGSQEHRQALMPSSSDAGRKLTILKQGMAANAASKVDPENSITNDKNISGENRRYESVVVITSTKRTGSSYPVHQRSSADRPNADDSDDPGEVVSKASEATEDIGPLHEGQTSSEGHASKVKRPDLLPLRLDSSSRPQSGKINETGSEKTSSKMVSATGSGPEIVVNSIELPLRYRKYAQNSTTGSRRMPGKPEQTGLPHIQENEDHNFEEEDETSDREQDILTAFSWVEQELRQMKGDDRRLARQLLDLRASIHQLRGMTDCQSFTSDELDLDPDWWSPTNRPSRSLDQFGALGGGQSSTVDTMTTADHRRTLAAVSSALVGSDSQLAGRGSSRQEYYV